MTGADTDAVAVPTYTQAVTLMLRICNPLSKQWMNRPEKWRGDPHYKAWAILRHQVEAFLERRSTLILFTEKADLAGALQTAHVLAHDHDTENTPEVSHCRCDVALQIRDLDVILSEA